MSRLPNNITELIAALEDLGKRNLNDEFDLFWSCRKAFENLKRLSDFDPSDLKKTIKTLKDLPPEIKELSLEELETKDNKLGSRALNKQDLKQLLEDYEKAQSDDQKEEIRKNFYLITGKKNVSQFIRVQNEIALKNKEVLDKLSQEARKKVLESLTKIKLTENEKLVEIIERASLEEGLNKKELEKELKKDGYSNKEVDRIIQKTIEVREEIKTQVGVERKNQISPEIKEEYNEVFTLGEQDKKEKLFEVVEKASLKDSLDTNELEKELKEIGYGNEEVNKIIQKTEETWPEIVSQKRETVENQISPEVKEKIIEDLALNSQGENEKLFEIIEKASLKEEQGFEIKELKKELKNKIKDPEKVEDLIQQVEEIRAEIKVEEKAGEIAKITYEKLLEEKLPIKKDVEAKIKNEILIAWREGDTVKIPSELQEIMEGEVIIKEAEKAANIFKNENLTAIVNYRSLELGREIGQELRKNGVEDETLIRDYVSVVCKLTNNPNSARIEENRSDIYNFVQSENKSKSPGEIERSIDEARFMANNVVMTPKKFNGLIQKYYVLREKIGSDNLPKVREVRVTEKIAAIFKNNPKMLKLMNGAQKMIGVWEKVGAFPGNLLTKLGIQEVGLKVLEKIGGQAAAALVKNAAAVIAKEGTVQGIKSIALGIIGKGAVAAGEGAAGGGALAGAVAAFQALPFVGQVIAVVVAAVVLLKPIIDGAKKLVGKITGFDMNGVKHFLSDSLGLGKVVGGMGQFVFDVGTFLIGIPALLGALNFGAILAPIIVVFFAGSFLYTMLQQQQISSIVPPADLGSCILKRGSGPNGTVVNGDINCDQNAPENEVPGLRDDKDNYVRVASGMILEGKDYASECYNDVVNRSLCAGINPLYALWAWMHESGASNYGTEIKVQDFGINDNSIAENFDAQIKVFLRLDPASNCDLNDPKLNGPDGYWLAWASSYLTGQCDPDVGQIQTGNTGRKYLEDMKKETWPWIANVPMPDDIYMPKGGQNCDEEGAPFSLTGPTKEIIGDNGQTYICSTSGGGGPSTMNPGGAPVAGSRTQCPFGSYSHNGIWAMDWGAGLGTPIFSTFSGIARLGEGNGYGFYIDIHSNYNGDDFFIRYAHMPAGGYRVSDGESVEAGQQIGIVDTTGFSTGNHLHYEVVGANIDWDNAGPYFGISQDEFNSLCR